MKTKTTLIAVVMVLIATLGFARDRVMEKSIPEDTDSNIKNLKLAYDLADYGYSNESPSALLQAAEILTEIPMQQLDAKAIQERIAAGDADTKHVYTAETLLVDAKDFAGKDKTFKNWISNVEKAVQSKSRGATGGPVYDEYFVYGRNCVYYDLYFDGGCFAEITVASYDGADLDLTVYDENGNMIVQDVSYASNCYVSFNPRWTGVFRIYIDNNAPYNATYRIVTN